jgi:hypothetical protein
MLEVDMASNRSASSCFLKVPSLEACSEEEGLWPQELWVEAKAICFSRLSFFLRLS